MDDVRPGPGATSDAVIVCDELVVRYGDRVAVGGLSLTARAGTVTALLGPNGAGKTSTVETLEGYRRPSSGTVSVLGLDPVADHAALVPRVGVMLQQGGVYPSLTPRQVLRLFAAYYDDPEEPQALLERVGISRAATTPVRRLSGGERQRLSLALALVGKPSVVFLDEPTAGVDPEGRLAVRDVVRQLRDAGVCVLLTTHELTEAERLADRVVIIAHGRALAEGTPTELTTRAADGAVRFTAPAGIDTAALSGALGGGTTVAEEEAGSYVVTPGPGAGVPATVAAVTGWLAGAGLAMGDLRTTRSLEEAYLAITAGAAGSEAGVAAGSEAGVADGEVGAAAGSEAGAASRGGGGRRGTTGRDA
ncbi:MAG: ABC transporter ATP-binding protein [Actinomycetota bacterium]|nr:ABC transporter ATP-binding protein [Actinomycetota bacterium]